VTQSESRRRSRDRRHPAGTGRENRRRGRRQSPARNDGRSANGSRPSRR